MLKHYDDWRGASASCERCHWSATGAEAQQGDLFESCYELCCPRCWHVIDIVALTTRAEMRANWDRLSERDRRAVLAEEERSAYFERRRLRSPADLPNVAAEAFVVLWDRDEDGDQVLRIDGRILWRETSFYESYGRFAEVARILQERYGTRIRDLVPTERSRLYLYGDRAGSVFVVANAREDLHAGRTVGGGRRA